jgi:hypothetical protein
MTIYNKYIDPITRLDKWQRHVIKEVFWQSTSGATFARGLNQNDKVTVYIPFNTNYMTYYVDPITFRENPLGYWTIQNGDIIVKGTVTDVITKQSELENKYTNAYNVTYLMSNLSGSANTQHLEIGGV